MDRYAVRKTANAIVANIDALYRQDKDADFGEPRTGAATAKSRNVRRLTLIGGSGLVGRRMRGWPATD